MEIIRSVKHEKVAQIIKLSDFANRNRSHCVPVYGSEALEWAITANLIIDSIFISQSADIPLLISKFPNIKNKYYITDFLNKKITNVSHITDVCALAYKNEKDIGNAMENSENIIALDRVLDHGNIGTIIRTMRCFGFNNLVFTNYNMDVYYKNIVNASRGEAFKIISKQVEINQLITMLRTHNYQIISTASNYSLNINDSTNILSGRINAPYALIFGNETNGIEPGLINQSDAVIGCPMDNGIDSLNVSVAAGIILNKLSQLSLPEYKI